MAYGDNERSSLWGLTSFGALATGGIYAAMKHGQAFKDAFSMGSKDIALSVARAASGTSRFAQEAVSTYVYNPDNLINTVKNLHSSNAIQTNQLKGVGYRAIMAGGKTTHEEAMALLSTMDQHSGFNESAHSMFTTVKSHGDMQTLESELRSFENFRRYSQSTGMSLGSTGISSGIEGINSAQPVLRGSLSKAQLKKLESIEGSFASALQGSNTNVSWEKVRMVEDTINGKTQRIPMLTGSIEGERFNIPLRDVGKTYGGQNLASRYVTRKGYMEGGKTLSYADLITETLTNAIRNSNKNRISIKEEVRAANQSLIEAMNERDSAARAAAIFTQPEQVMTSGALAKSRLASQEALSFGVNDEGAAALINSGKLFPYVSPVGASKNMLTQSNLARGLFGDLGGLIEDMPELRPSQFVRSEWGVTENAKASATPFKGTFGQHYNRLDRKIKGSQYDRMLYNGKSVTSRQAYSAPQLVTFYAKQGPLGWQSEKLNRMISAEQGVVTSKAAQMLEYERVVSKTIALNPGLEASSQLMSSLQGKKYGEFVPMSIGEGKFIGQEMGTGASISLSNENNIMQEVIGAELSGPNKAKVYIRDVQRLEHNQRWKLFSEGNRYGVQSEDDIGRFLSEAGFKGKTIAGQEIEAMFSAKLVARNPLALVTQQIEAASMFAAHKFGSNLPADAAAFLANPSAALNVSGHLQAGSQEALYQIQKSLVGLATDWGFNKQEMALTFGLMEKGTLDRLSKEGSLSPRKIEAIRRSSGVFGLDKGRLGDLITEGGAGGRASLEQTGVRLMAMKGEEGQMFASELAGRIQGHGELSAINKMEASILNQEGMINKFKRSGASTEDFINLARENLVQQEGRFVNLGRSVGAFGGASSLYIPGLQEAPMSLGSVIAKGERIQSPVVKALSDFQYQLQLGAKASSEEVEASAAMLRNVVAQTSAEQASARGRVFGSAYLGGVRQDTHAGRANPFSMRVSSRRAESMYGDLLSRAGTAEEKAFLSGQLQKLQEGGSVMSAMWRHPSTGPESMQFVNLTVDTELADNLIAAPYKAGKITMQDGRVLHADLSELVGFKGDFDNDHYNIAAIANRDLNARLEKKYASSISGDYTNYVFNHYAMKDLIDSRMSTKQVMDAATRSKGYDVLGKAKKETGGVNIALQKFKLAVSAAAPDQYRPLGELFFHLEEAAISKHGENLGGSSLFKNIVKAAEPTTSRDEAVSLMEQSITHLLGGKEDITGTLEGKAYTLNKDPRKWSEQAVDALNAVREDVDAAMDTAKLAKGKGTDMSYDDVLRAFNARKTSIDPSVATGQALYAGSDALSERGASLVRKTQIKASAFMGALNKAKKPLLLGAAAAAGVMLMAPSLSGRIKEGPGGGKNMSSQDFGPPSGQGMAPPPPRPNIAPRVYDLGGGKQTSHANIRMRVNDLNHSSKDFMQSAREMSNGGQIHIRTRDDRSALDPRMLANKIQERL